MSTTDWNEQELGDILTLNYGWSLPEKKRVPGDAPVYGSNGIVGTHQHALVASPGLIVGRKGSAGNVHFSRKPFCPIDTTFYIAPSDTSLDIEFLYFLLLHIDLKRILGDVGVPGLSREMAYKEKTRFPIGADEQRKIAGVLTLVQRALEQQERLIALTTELKKTLLHQLFTAGLRGEPQKQTEIDSMPESWDVMRLRDLCDLIVDCPHTTPKFQADGIRVARNFNIRDGRFVTSPAFYTSGEEYQQRIKRAEPLPGDILFSREAPVGEACVIPDGMKLSLGQRTMLLRAREGILDAQFMVYCFYAPNVRSRMLASSSGLTVPHLNVADVRDLLVPIPPLPDQQQIATAILTADNKGECHRKNHAALTALFHTLLHQLMTAQTRVCALDLSRLPEDV